jgi:hypothetical protein
MSKINILNLVLFIIVITLAIVIYYSEEPNTQLDRLTDLDVISISSINIQHNKNKTNLIKNNQRWEITQPISVGANDFRINSLLKLLNAPIHSQYSIDDINLTDIGLEKSATTISFDGQEITFGIDNTATGLRYIQLNNSIFTIEDVYYPFISSNFSTLVSFNLLPNDSRITKLILGEVFIYLENKQEPITYVVADDDPWLILARPELGLEYHLNIEAYNKLIEPR